MDTLNSAMLSAGGTTGISALIQVQQSVSEATRAGIEATRADVSGDEDKARQAAEQFEALLIHSMLKSMRKTTMAENTSNQRAIYDDMLDKNLADSMIKAGGLGIADQLMRQLHDPARPRTAETTSAGNQGALTQDRLRLRELADNIRSRADSTSQTSMTIQDGDHAESSSSTDTGLARLKMLSELWGSQRDADRDVPHTRREFIDSLAPHARQSARRLGTSTSAVLAIAALETGWGRSLPTDDHGDSGHNYFGIKATSASDRHTRNRTTEYVNGQAESVEARFKSYDSPADSVAGFADFLLDNPRYSTALAHAGNPERFIRELHDAGYATDPRYAEKAINVMRQVEQHKVQP